METQQQTKTNKGDTPTETPVKPTPKKKPARKPRTFLVNGRYEHPPFGGIPMPPGVAFYGFATVKCVEGKFNAGITESDALKALIQVTGADVLNLTVEGVSILPAKW
ncbi:MAG: hypothetical protein AAGJ82_07840 [Bacteroidota bacterium]